VDAPSDRAGCSPGGTVVWSASAPFFFPGSAASFLTSVVPRGPLQRHSALHFSRPASYSPSTSARSPIGTYDAVPFDGFTRRRSYPDAPHGAPLQSRHPEIALSVAISSFLRHSSQNSQFDLRRSPTLPWRATSLRRPSPFRAQWRYTAFPFLRSCLCRSARLKSPYPLCATPAAAVTRAIFRRHYLLLMSLFVCSSTRPCRAR